MSKIILAAALTSTLALAAVPAFAQEGNGEPFPSRGHAAVVADVPVRDAGSERLPDPTSAHLRVAVVEGDVLPTGGSEGTVQTANSLPRGAMDGTVAYAQAQSVRRYLAQQAAAPTRIARAPGGGPRG